jgi:glycosyltransferase involved in cell wall biosynthesis
VSGAAVLSHLVFALPDGSDLISGGNRYNEQLVRALVGRANVSCANIASARARIERGEPGLYFVDSLNLSDFASFPPQRAAQRYGLIVHHLPSLEPDLDPADPALQVERDALGRFDVLLATSPFTAEFLRSRGHEPERILTVPPAPPASPDAPRTIEPPFTFAWVGNLIPRKSMLELLRALDTRIRDSDRFFIELAGRSDLDAEYARECLQLLRDSEQLRSVVRYLGAIPNDEVLELCRRAAAFVSAAKMETFGMAIQEARACGLPILALDGGYARHHFTAGETGLLFGSIEELADGLLALVRTPDRLRAWFDSAQRLRLDSDYTWERAAESLLEQLTRYSSSLLR